MHYRHNFRCGPRAAAFKLPFHFPGVIPQRLHIVIDREDHLEFCGRKVFQKLYNTARERDPKQQRRLHLRGTLGARKLHLLTVLVCLK